MYAPELRHAIYMLYVWESVTFHRLHVSVVRFLASLDTLKLQVSVFGLSGFLASCLHSPVHGNGEMTTVNVAFEMEALCK